MNNFKEFIATETVLPAKAGIQVRLAVISGYGFPLSREGQVKSDIEKYNLLQ